MSYVVHVWEHAAPETLKAAQALHERLSGMPAPAGNKFSELARALTQRFPVEVGGAAADDKSGEPLDWVESSPDGVSPTAVYSLALYGGGLDQLLPVLIDTATDLGLTVYDDQAGQVFLPGGWVLDDAGRHDKATMETPPATFEYLTPARFKTALKAWVAARLNPLGFSCKMESWGAVLRRKTPIGEQKLTVQMADSNGVSASLAAELIPNLTQALAEIVAPQTSIYVALGPCAALQSFAEPVAGHDPWPTFKVFSADDLQRWLGGYEDMLRAELLPLLDDCRDTAGLLDCDEHPERFPARLKPSLVTLALARHVGLAQVDWQRKADRYRDSWSQRYLGHPHAQAWTLRITGLEEPMIIALEAMSQS